MLNAKFTIRVYGLLYNEHNQVLVADEIYNGSRITKFPGGGMEYGEGTIDCLKRECMEELGQEVDVLDHVYTTDFFLPSIFDKDYQVLCVYYHIKTKEKPLFKTTQSKFDFPEEKDGVFVFRWLPIDEMLLDELTFENDRRVAQMMLKSEK